MAFGQLGTIQARYLPSGYTSVSLATHKRAEQHYICQVISPAMLPTLWRSLGTTVGWYPAPYLFALGLVFDDGFVGRLLLLLLGAVIGRELRRTAVRLDLAAQLVGARLDRHAGAVEGERKQTLLALQTLVADRKLPPQTHRERRGGGSGHGESPQYTDTVQTTKPATVGIHH